MKLWLFTFTQPDRMIASARMAAPNKITACVLMGQFIGRPLSAMPNRHPEPGTILTFLGALDVAEPGLVSLVDNQGEVRVAA